MSTTSTTTSTTTSNSRLSAFAIIEGEVNPTYFVSFSGGYMRFSNTCLDAMNDTDFVQIYINKDEKQLAVRPVSAGAKNKFSFLYNWRRLAEEAKRTGTHVPQKEAKIGRSVREFRRIFGIEGNQKFEGAYYEDEGILIFDLK